MNEPNPDELEALLRAELSDDLDEIGRTATCTAIQAHVTIAGDGVFDFAGGRTRLDDEGRPVDTSTPFDLASLTKPLVTSTLLMQAVDAGRAGWTDRLNDHLPGWPDDGSARSKITLLQLLNHTSGLPDWRPLYEASGVPATPEAARRARETLVDRIAEIPLDAPPGAAETYSDLGYMLLCAVLESIYGESLDVAAQTRVFDPLELERTRFAPVDQSGRPVPGAPATEHDPTRGGVVAGTVHDRNCEALGGVSGHAGVFGTAREVARLANHLLAIDAGPPPDAPLVSRESLRFCWSPDAGGPGHHRGCWDTPSGETSSAGRGLAAGRTVGHLGFTGTSVWIERDRRLTAVLLTNRTYPDRDNERIGPLRVRFHEALVPPSRPPS